MDLSREARVINLRHDLGTGTGIGGADRGGGGGGDSYDDDGEGDEVSAEALAALDETNIERDAAADAKLSLARRALAGMKRCPPVRQPALLVTGSGMTRIAKTRRRSRSRTRTRTSL